MLASKQRCVYAEILNAVAYCRLISRRRRQKNMKMKRRRVRKEARRAKRK